MALPYPLEMLLELCDARVRLIAGLLEVDHPGF